MRFHCLLFLLFMYNLVFYQHFTVFQNFSNHADDLKVTKCSWTPVSQQVSLAGVDYSLAVKCAPTCQQVTSSQSMKCMNFKAIHAVRNDTIKIRIELCGVSCSLKVICFKCYQDCCQMEFKGLRKFHAILEESVPKPCLYSHEQNLCMYIVADS